MALDFTKCIECGKIFPADKPDEDMCPTCAGIDPETSDKDMLRTLKNTLRDVQARGEFLNIPQLAEESGVEEVKIWHYINTGELSTATFNDPAVKEYLVRKKRDQAKAAQKTKDEKNGKNGKNEPAAPKASKPSGFHGAKKR